MKQNAWQKRKSISSVSDKYGSPYTAKYKGWGPCESKTLQRKINGNQAESSKLESAPV
jgi:hypothetical protein